MDKELYFECFKLCSGHFLYKKIDESWKTMTYEQQMEYLNTYPWQEVKDMGSSELLNYIEDAAKATYVFVKEKL